MALFPSVLRRKALVGHAIEARNPTWEISVYIGKRQMGSRRIFIGLLESCRSRKFEFLRTNRAWRGGTPCGRLGDLPRPP